MKCNGGIVPFQQFRICVTVQPKLIVPGRHLKRPLFLKPVVGI